MILKGANIDDTNVEYKGLSDYQLIDNPELKPIIRNLELFYYSILKEALNSNISPFPINDNKVTIIPGMLNHRCTNDIENIRSISQNGILATEWFGKLESEGEGRYCAFVDRIKDPSFVGAGSNINRLTAPSDEIVLFFDDNDIMKKLIHLDYFEYEKIKKEDPSRIKELYTDKEIELFDKLIEPLSPYGVKYHDESKKQKQFYYWSAIPGGIPSILVNGICIKNKEYSEEYIKELSRLFPNATIFNGKLDIIYRPENIIDESKSIS